VTGSDWGRGIFDQDRTTAREMFVARRKDKDWPEFQEPGTGLVLITLSPDPGLLTDARSGLRLPPSSNTVSLDQWGYWKKAEAKRDWADEAAGEYQVKS